MSDLGQKMVEMNLFVSSTFFRDGTSIEEALTQCEKHDICNIELGSNHKYSDNFNSIIKSFRFRYLVHNYFPIPQKSFVLNLASSDKEIVERSIKHVYEAIDFCEMTGSLLYTFHPGFLSDPKGPNTSSINYDFQWDESAIKLKNSYKNAFDTMLSSIDKCAKYASQKKVRIAIETEGSFQKHAHLLMQRPEEFEQLFKYFNPNDLGINLNVGHLKLAMNYFKFPLNSFLDLINEYLVAMELSHNNGIEDQHLPLIENEWYWKTIFDPRFKNAYKILEFRDVSIHGIQDNIKLFKKMFYELQIS
jgi:sugar phosphate isomerase/epimerase